MIHYYTLVLANNDRLYTQDERDFNEYKNYLANNAFIEIKRKGTHQKIGNTIYFRPEIASYRTDSIVYVEDNTKEHYDSIERQTKYLKEKQELIYQIKIFIPNIRFKWWLKRNFVTKKGFKSLNYTNDFLQLILDKCKKYHCKKSDEDSFVGINKELRVINDVIRCKMIEHGFLMCNIADELKIPISKVEEAFSYERFFSYPQLEQICNLIGVSVEEIMTEAKEISNRN